MPIVWDDAKEKQLLLSIIHFLQPSAASIPWSEVAKQVDPDASEKACSEKLKKLRYAAKAQFGEAPASAEGGRTPKTPAKRDAKTSTEDGGSKSTRKRKSRWDLDEKAETAADEESPTKKVKEEEAMASEAVAEKAGNDED